MDSSRPAIPVEREISALLLERLRAGLLIVLLATAVFALGEVWLESDAPSILAMPKLAQIAAVLAAMLLAPRMKEWVVPLALVLVAVFSATTAASNILRQDVITALPTMVLLAVGTGILFPWGALAQLAAVLLAGTALLANVYWVEGHIGVVTGYPALTIAGVFAASVYIAYAVQSYQRAGQRQELERRRAELALRESSQLLRTVVTGAPIVLFAIDRQGVFTLSEGSGLALIGLASGQMVGKSVYETYGHLMIGRYERALSGESPSGMVRVGEVVFDVSCSPLRDESGEITGVVGVCTDITERQRAEEALRRSESHFRSLTENALDVISVLRPDGTFTYASPSHERVVGYTQAELTDLDALSLVHPDDRSRVAAALREVVENPGRTAAVEARFRHKNGAWIAIESIGTLLPSELGAGVVVNSRDVTERKQAELKTKVLLEVAGTISGTLDVGSIVDRVQRATAEMLPCDCVATFRFEPEEGVSRMVSHHGLTTEIARAAEGLAFRSGELFEGRLEAGETIVLDSREDQPPALRDRLAVEGMVVAPLRVRDRHLGALVAANLERSEPFTAGQVELCSGIAQQLAVSIAAGELYHTQLEEAEISSALTNMARELISTLNTPALLDRLCQLTTQVLGCDCSHTFLLDGEEQFVVPVSEYGDTAEEWEALRVIKVPRSMIARLLERLKDDQAVQVVMDEPQDLVPPALPQRYGITVALYIALFRGEQVIGLLSAACRGRSDRFGSRQMLIAKGISRLASITLANARLVEDLERANRLKSDFVATMSHELRTPIHVVLGYTNLLREREFGPLTPEQDGVLDRVEKGTAQLLDLVNATLDLSRLEAGRVPLWREQVEVASLLKEVDAEMRDVKHKPGVRVDWDVGAGLAPLTTDAAKLKVVVKNLIGNAFKFTDAGCIKVCARALEDGVEISVYDTGIGIAPEIAPFIFEAFRQGDGSNTRRYGGVGLGLYIVRRLLDLLGGEISVESQPGRGSTFRVRLPLRGSEEPGDATAGTQQPQLVRRTG